MAAMQAAGIRVCRSPADIGRQVAAVIKDGMLKGGGQ
jgi:hypothetical protein